MPDDESLHWLPKATQHDRQQIAWVSEGVDAGDPAGTFQTDGQVFHFSTLSPEPAPDGSLVLYTIDRLPLNLAVFAVVIVGGLLLLPAGAGLRALAAGLLLVALVACGVFASTFAVQVIDAELAAAVFVVLVIWVVWYFVFTRPRARARRRASQAEQPPPRATPAGPPGPDSSQPSVTGQPPQEGPSGEATPESDRDEGGKTDE